MVQYQVKNKNRMCAVLREGIGLVSDIIIVGAGVVGCALARVLSRYHGSITVLEKAGDVAEGASKANSGIVHAGFDAHPGTLKARLNVEGAKMYPELCRELGVPYSQPGALVLGFSEEDRATLENLVRQGEANGVPGVRLVERDEILQMEPQTNPAVLCALYAPTSGLTSPYEMTFALADHAALNGVRFERDTQVQAVSATETGWKVETNRGEFTAKVLVNCAGVFSAKLHNMISDTRLNIIYRRGQYYLLDRMTPLPFTMTMFQCPTKMGKGSAGVPHRAWEHPAGTQRRGYSRGQRCVHHRRRTEVCAGQGAADLARPQRAQLHYQFLRHPRP